MRQFSTLFAAAILALGVLTQAAVAKDRPYGTNRLIAVKVAPSAMDPGAALTGLGGGQFTKVQIEQFRCASAGNPAAAVDISCNTTEYGQDWAPDNEIAVAVDPRTRTTSLPVRTTTSIGSTTPPARARRSCRPGSSRRSTEARRGSTGRSRCAAATAPATRSPAFDRRHGVVLMAQLENTGGQGGAFVTQGDVSVSRSDRRRPTWSEPITVFQGAGTGIGPANQATSTTRNGLRSTTTRTRPFYGRAYVTTTRFLNGPGFIRGVADLLELVGRWRADVDHGYGDLGQPSELHLPESPGRVDRVRRGPVLDPGSGVRWRAVCPLCELPERGRLGR